MNVSVVITTFNRRPSLERCLESLAAQDFPFKDFEVVVISDGSTDDTSEFLRQYKAPFKLRWFQQDNMGQPAAQNRGVAEAAGAVIIFLDDDCICNSEFVAGHWEAHVCGDRILGLGATLFHPDSPPGSFGILKRELAESELQHLTADGADDRDMMLCANSSIARLVALAYPFDSAFARMHDVDAGQRLLVAGFRPKFVRKSVVHELFTKTIAGNLMDSRFHGKYEVVLTRKFPKYKAYSGIGQINEGHRIKRALRKWTALHPQWSELILSAIFAFADALKSISSFANAARRVLQARFAVQHLAGAIQEAGSWDALEEAFGKRVCVLMYHNVGAPRPGEYPGLTVPTREFEKQLQFLLKLGYATIRPSDWVQWRDAGGKLPNQPIMLIFDDAYEEAAQIAFPLLEKYGLVAGCMVISGCIGTTNRWDEERGAPSFKMMSADQILDWSRRGIEFGGHTHTHPNLPDVDEVTTEREMAICAEELTRLLGKPPASFAYPFGGMTDAAERSARKHFSIAFSAWPGMLHLRSNQFRAPRNVFLPGESRFGIWCRLRIGKNLFEFTRNRWRRIRGYAEDGTPYATK